MASVAAATLAIGIASAAPAAQAGPGCTWQPLTLTNGWHSEQGAYGTGDPSVCSSTDGMVYLSGSVAAPSSNSSSYFATLPAGYAPPHTDYFTVYTYNGAVGTVRINTDGTMQAYYGKATQYTSLAGISYAGATAGVVGLMPLLAGWQSAQAEDGTGNPGYYVSNGFVHLDGSVYHPGGTPQWGSDTAWTFAQLPPAAAPAHCMTTNVYTFAGGTNFIWIPAGTGAIHGANAQYTSLAGVSYPAPSTPWQPLSLVNSVNTFACDTAGSAIGNGVVYLTGYIGVSQGYSGEFAVLPAGQHPTHTLYLNVNGTGTGSNVWVSLRVDPDGAISVFNEGGYSTGGYVSLAGLSFQVTS